MKLTTLGSGSHKILIIPGWMHTSRLYIDLARRIAEKSCVHITDVVGVGSSLDSLSTTIEKIILDTRYDLIYGSEHITKDT